MSTAEAYTVPMKNNKPDITNLIDEHSTMLYRFCRSITYSKEDAEDLFQETWVLIMQKPIKIDIATNPQSVLCREALFLWKSKQRKYARRKRIAPETLLETEITDIKSGQNVEAEFLQKEEKEFVQKLVDKLHPKFRIPIILYYNLDMDITEIAKTLNLPPGTVKSRLFSARQTIRKGVDKFEKD